MFTVYILHCRKGSYVGQTCDLQRRLHQHFTGECYQSRKLEVTGLAHRYDVPTHYEALKLESYLQNILAKDGESALYDLIAEMSFYSSYLRAEALDVPDNLFQAKVKQLESEGKMAPGYAGELYNK